MKKLIYAIFFMILYCGTLSAQDNLVVNGGFEDATPIVQYTATTTDVTNWLLEIQNGACSFMVTDQEVGVYEGVHGLVVNVSELGSDSWSLQAVNDPVELDDGEWYKASLMVKTLAADSAHMAFTIGMPSYSELGRLGSSSTGQYALAVFNEWRKLTMNFMAVGGDVRVPIHFQDLAIFYIDDLQIIESEICEAVIDETGDYLMLDLGVNISEVPAAFALSNIKVKVNGSDREIESLEIDTESYWPFRNGLKAKVIGRIGTGSTVTVSHTKDATSPLAYDDSRVDANYPNDRVPSFSNFAVENMSTVVGVKEFHPNTQLTWYLNDSRDFLTVSGLDNGNNIDIYSISGQLMKSIKVSSNRQTISVSDLNPGIYILSVKFRDKSSANAKILK